MPVRSAILVAILAGARVAAGQADAGAAPPVEVRSDRLRVDHGRREATFEGNVRASFGRLSLECETMDVTYDDTGAVISLEARGHIAVRRDAARASADRARLDARLGVLVLEGRPVLVQGQNRLEGTRISVHLGSGRLEVVGARGVFHVPIGQGASR